jgi:DNA-binding MarR family transcriptional regulator
MTKSKDHRTLDQAEYELLAEFRQVLRRFLLFSKTAAEQVGLTPQQHQVLLAIRGRPAGCAITVGELAERLQIRPHSAVGLVDRLVDRALLERVTSPDDRRQVHLVLTPDAEALLERLTAAHKAELKQIGPVLSLLLERIAKST